MKWNCWKHSRKLKQGCLHLVVGTLAQSDTEDHDSQEHRRHVEIHASKGTWWSESCGKSQQNHQKEEFL
jgi:hypothetical protein